jgi:hypothetical protein
MSQAKRPCEGGREEMANGWNDSDIDEIIISLKNVRVAMAWL